MTIRRASVDDAPAIQALIRSVYQEYGFTWDPQGYHRDLYEFELHYLEPYGAYWVVEEDGQIVGGGGLALQQPCAGEPGSLVEDEDGLLVAAGADCELVRMYLRPSTRGKGVGRLIANQILSYARQQKLQLMEIWSDKALTLAHPFYRKLGAEPLGERVSNDPDQAEELGFLLFLQPERDSA
jgi:putative acetyltransferase